MEKITAGKWIIASLFDYANKEISTENLDLLVNRYGEDFSDLEEIKDEWIGKRANQRKLKKLIEKIAYQAHYSWFSSGYENIFDSLSYPSNMRMNYECMWILINIACRKKDISESQTSLLQSLKNDWKIEDPIILEMQDTAETLVAMKEYNELCKTMNWTGMQRSKKEFSMLIDNIECLIGDISENYDVGDDSISNKTIWEAF